MNDKMLLGFVVGLISSHATWFFLDWLRGKNTYGVGPFLWLTSTTFAANWFLFS